MKKTIITVIIVIGVLVLGLLIWNAVFSDGGVLESVWDGVVGPINETWKKITGSGTNLIPVWDTLSPGDGTGGLSDLIGEGTGG